jgi:hypothetical protein
MRASSALLTAPPKGSLTTGAVSAAAASCGTSGRVGAARATCSKRERTSQEGYDSISSCAARLSDAERSAALWQRLQQLESRNRELEQVVERMSATHISHRRAGQGSCAGEDSALPSAGSMEVDTTCSSAGMQRLQHPYVSKVLEQAHQARHRQAQAPHGQLGEQQEQPQQPLQQADGAAEHLSLPQQVVTLQREVKRLQQLNTMLQRCAVDNMQRVVAHSVIASSTPPRPTHTLAHTVTACTRAAVVLPAVAPLTWRCCSGRRRSSGGSLRRALRS